MMAVLAYHKVDDKFELGFTNVKPGQFVRQVSSLMRHGIVIGDPTNQSAMDRTKAYLTFDDGYDSFYRNVVPYLSSIGTKAAVFVISDFIGRENSWDLRLSYAPFVHMNKNQLREICELGYEIGSHSCSHRDLSRLDHKSSWNELVNSKKKIEEIIGKEIRSLSFPYGRHNRYVVDQAREAGYEILFGLGSVVCEGVVERIPVYRIDGPAAVRRKAAMNRFEILKSDFIHSFANISALISMREKPRLE
ncbi:MAG: polysaccharide deacetylase family protein [Candidatus Kryptoniota bacterium]